MSPKKAPPKFPMHDVYMEKAIKNVKMAVLASMSAGFLFYMLHSLPLRNAYTNFYANYNANDSFKRMMAAGVFNSCQVPKEGAGDKKDAKKDDKKKL